MKSMNLRLGLVGLGAAVLVAGCAPKLTWNPTQPSPSPMAKRDVSSVQVFDDKAPERPHVEVGVIAGQKKRSTSTDVRAKLTEAMHKKAAKLGCDAIHVRDVSEAEIPGSKKQPPISLEAGCLMWTAEATPAVPPPGAQPPPPAAAPPPPAAPLGCANDMQCKGNRICENGQCVSPPSPTTGPAADGGAPTASGKKCDMDTDCPGDEICQNHLCANPD